MKVAKGLFALMVCLALVLSAACGPTSPPPPAAFTLTDALAREDGQTGHAFWYLSAFRDLDLRCSLEGFPAGEGERLSPEISTGEAPAKALMDILDGLPLEEDSRREEQGRPAAGTGAAFSLSYNTAEEQENEPLYLLPFEGRLYFLSGQDADASGYSYAVQGGQERAEEVLAQLWAEGDKMVYHVAVYAQPDRLRPDSQMVGVVVSCDTDDPLTVRGVSVGVGDAAPLEGLDGTVVQGIDLLQIPLEDLPPAPEETPYTLWVTLAWRQGTDRAETADFSAQLTITPQGELLYRAPDPMTPEQQAVYDRYLRPFWGGLLYSQEFDQEHYPQNLGAYLMFLTACQADGGPGPQSDEEGWLAGDAVEKLVSRYFLVTPEQYRRLVWPYDPSLSDGDGYDAAGHRYRFMGGLGGAYPYAQVDASRPSGDLLEIDYTMYSIVDDGVDSRATLTVQLLPDGGFVYLANHITYHPQAD